LGIEPSDQQEISGQGVQHIVIEGLIVEGATRRGLGIFGPANQYASAVNPTENVLVRHVIARNNVGGNVAGDGIRTEGKLVNVTIEYCEVYNNTDGGIGFGRVSKTWHEPEPEDDMSAAQYSTIRNNLIYDNVHPDYPGNTDGLGGSHMYRCTIADTVTFGNSDDGMDVYASIEVTVTSNIVFGHSYEGGNNAGIKFSAGGGGRHHIARNVVFNNDGYSFEGSSPNNALRTYYPSRLIDNLGYNGGLFGFSLGSGYTTYPGFERIYLRNNVALDNALHDFAGGRRDWVDSDYNFISDADDLADMRDIGQDVHSLTGDPQLANKHVVIDTHFDPTWSVEKKLAYIRDQVKVAFKPLSESNLIDAGTLIDGYHHFTPGEHPGERVIWYGDDPDIGPYEYVPVGGPELALQGTPGDEAIRLTWLVTGTLPASTTWHLEYYTQTNSLYTATDSFSTTRAYTLTGLTNGVWYTVTLNGVLDGTPFLTDTVRVMPVGAALQLHAAPGDGQAHLTWGFDPAPATPFTGTWRIGYESDTGTLLVPPVEIPTATARSYTLAGLANGVGYTVTLDALVDGASWLSASARVTPGGHRVYLPLVLRAY